MGRVREQTKYSEARGYTQQREAVFLEPRGGDSWDEGDISKEGSRQHQRRGLKNGREGKGFPSSRSSLTLCHHTPESR